MNQPDHKIEPMKKITLLLEAGTQPGKMDLTTGPQSFEFIFGIGSQGFTPFEYHLADKTEQEETELKLRTKEMPETFQHLSPLPLNIPDQIETFHLKIKIISITTADSREVVKAMAEAAACGDHCCGP